MRGERLSQRLRPVSGSLGRRESMRSANLSLRRWELSCISLGVGRVHSSPMHHGTHRLVVDRDVLDVLLGERLVLVARAAQPALVGRESTRYAERQESAQTPSRDRGEDERATASVPVWGAVPVRPDPEDDYRAARTRVPASQLPTVRRPCPGRRRSPRQRRRTLLCPERLCFGDRNRRWARSATPRSRAPTRRPPNAGTREYRSRGSIRGIE